MTEPSNVFEMSGYVPQTPPTTVSSVRVKAPRRILHFSDGTLEEYSTDDETDVPDGTKDTQIDVVSSIKLNQTQNILFPKLIFPMMTLKVVQLRDSTI